MKNKLLIVVISWKRPDLLNKTLRSIRIQVGEGTIVYLDTCRYYVVDNETSKETQDVMRQHCCFNKIIETNIGINKAVELLLQDIDLNNFDYIMFSDHDMEYKTSFDRYINVLEKYKDIGIVTGHHAPEHKVIGERIIDNEKWLIKDAVRGCHMVMRKEFFESNLPLRHNSKVDFDWWFMRDGPNNTKKIGFKCLVYPGGAIHIGYNRSTWAKSERPEYNLDELAKMRKI